MALMRVWWAFKQISGSHSTDQGFDPLVHTPISIYPTKALMKVTVYFLRAENDRQGLRAGYGGSKSDGEGIVVKFDHDWDRKNNEGVGETGTGEDLCMLLFKRRKSGLRGNMNRADVNGVVGIRLSR
ncbi:hypothetical protein H2248_006995 [Termitomyces sp. 'cryptogamus']|nr:hypothetical protein H2248_006995 [Termitomyces sp. 'cryptogamus']